MVWDFKPVVTREITYEKNKCDSLLNSDSYEPDFLGLLVPKTEQNLILMDKSTQINIREMNDAPHK